MPALKNAKHEEFAKGVAKGLPLYQAYIDAGYEGTTPAAAAVSANRLLKREDVAARARELFSRNELVEFKSSQKAIEKLAISKESILAELAKIGFSDMRKVLTWGPEIIVEGEDGKALVTNGVAIKPSDQIDDVTAAAIAEIRQTKEGIVVKLHDKKGALLDLLKHFDPPPDDPKDITPGEVIEHDRLEHITSRFVKGLGVVEGGQGKKKA